MNKSRTIRKPLIFLFLFPFLFLLAACETHSILEIGEGGTAKVSVQIKDDSGFMINQGFTCQAISDQLNLAEDFGTNSVTVTDNSVDKSLNCSIIAENNENVVDGTGIKETFDTYIFTVEGSEFSDEQRENLKLFNTLGINFTFAVKMPGKIIQADGAEISGNTALFKDATAFGNGIKVEGMKYKDGTPSKPNDKADANDNTAAGDKPSSSKQTDAGKDSSSQSTTEKSAEKSSMNPWLIGGMVLAAIAFFVVIGIIVLVTKRNKANNSAPNPYAGGYQVTNSYGQNAGYQPGKSHLQGGYQPNTQAAPQQSGAPRGIMPQGGSVPQTQPSAPLSQQGAGSEFFSAPSTAQMPQAPGSVAPSGSAPQYPNYQAPQQPTQSYPAPTAQTPMDPSQPAQQGFNSVPPASGNYNPYEGSGSQQ